MKKIIIVLFICSLAVIFFKQEKDILIPNNAIRFRIIANSNTLEDQNKKSQIKNNIEKDIYKLIEGANDTVEAKNLLQQNMNKIKNILDSYNVSYDINYGYNYFPTKNYKGVLYPAGNFESLVITLGEGKGDNFWCVLFPPLCLLDNDKKDVGEIDYQFYVKNILDKF